MKPKSKLDKLGKKKKYVKNDTSYSSFWLYNKDNDVLCDDFKDKLVLSDKNIFSEFSPVVAKNVISFWSDEEDYVLDPFAGRVRGFICQAMKRFYTGFEVVDDYYFYLKNHNHMSIPYPPMFIRDDCINISEYINFKYDLIFTCPPYWNLEKYVSCDGQLSDIDSYDLFLDELFFRLEVSIKFLKKDKFVCVVVGDFRRNKKFYSFHSDLIQRMSVLDCVKLHDIVAVQNIPFFASAFYFGSKKKYKYTAKSHEYLLVWKKV